MRRILLALLATLVVVAGITVAAVATSSGSSVTRARLEHSLPTVFSNLYVQQASLLGRDGMTPASLDASAMCDKHGATGEDVGPGGDWVCLMSWTDPDVPMPTEGYGKFELNVHSNGCYTAAGPSKLIGFLTLTDTTGADVQNPVFEFDGCFDPASDNTPTGVTFPSLLTATSTTLTPDADGKVGVQVTCGTGSGGCRGKMTVTAGGTGLGSVDVRLVEEASATLAVPGAVPSGAMSVDATFVLTEGVGPTKPVTIPVQGG